MDILVTIFTAFISGVLATAMGALGSVILTALVSIVGVFSIMAGCEYNIIGNICFGIDYSGAHWFFRNYPLFRLLNTSVLQLTRVCYSAHTLSVLPF